jgi:hypothetical protein
MHVNFKKKHKKMCFKEKILPRVTCVVSLKNAGKFYVRGNFFSVFGMVKAETQRQATQRDCFS